MQLFVAAFLYLLVVLGSASWLPGITRIVFYVGLVAIFARAGWLFGKWNPSLSGWRRVVVMVVGGLVVAGAVGFVTVAILFDYLPMMGYRE